MFTEGKRAAKQRDCKYTEISATIGHNVDQLLVGVLQQIRLSRHHTKLHQTSSLSTAMSATRSRAATAVDHPCRQSSVGRRSSAVGPAVGLDANCLLQARNRVLDKIMSSLSLGCSSTSSSVCDNLYQL